MSRLTREQVLWALAMHTGAEHGASAAELVAEILGERCPGAERELRTVIEQLRREGHHICGTPAHGYFTAANEAELLRTCSFLYARAMTTLAQVAAMRRVALPDLRGQLRIPHEFTPPASPAGRAAGGRANTRSASASTPTLQGVMAPPGPRQGPPTPTDGACHEHGND